MIDLKSIEVGDRTQLPYLLKYLGLVGEGIEIGVQTGVYSEYILARSDLKKLYLCDPWRHLDNGYEPHSNIVDDRWQADLDATIERLARYQDRYQIVRKTSMEAVKDFADESLDFVYIDADHRYDYAKEDIANWWPKVKVGGVFAGHDYYDSQDLPSSFPYKEYADHYGVKRAVQEFFGSREFFVTQEEWPSWYLIK